MRQKQRPPGLNLAILRSVILPMVALMIVASIGSLIVTNYRTSSEIREHVAEVAAAIRPQLSEIAWELDYDLLEAVLSSQLGADDVVAAEIALTEGFELRLGAFDEVDGSLSAGGDLTWDLNGVSAPLGTFTLYGTRSSAISLGYTRAVALIIISSIAIALTTLGIYLNLRQRVIRPIEEFEQVLNSPDKRVEDHDFTISEASERNMAVEVRDVFAAVKAMRGRLIDYGHELVESQRQLGRAAQIAGIGYAVLDTETGKAISCDGNFAGLVGSTVDEVMSQNFLTNMAGAYPADQTPEDRAARMEALMRGRTLIETFRFKRSDGGLNHVRVIIEPTSRPGRESPLLEMAAFDLTDLHDIEERARQSEKMQTIGKLTGGVAHDFNNILAIISGNLELIEGVDDIEEARPLAANARAAVDRGAMLTSQLLSFARKQPLSPVLIHPARLINEIEPLLRMSIGASINLELVRDSGLWSTVVDPTQLQTGIINLVVNARDAMPDGGKLTIECSNARIDQEYANLHLEVRPGQYVCIAVTDTGTGMSPDILGQAVDPFFTTKSVGQGTGLGLSMLYGFVKQSDGHLKIYSEPGHGTTVKIYLPRSMAAGDNEQVPTEPAKKPLLRGIRVLLVEDEEALRALYARQLETIGCIVTNAETAAEALALCAKMEKPDLLLTDIVLPGAMNGKTLAAQVQDLFPGIAIVYMSGFTENAIIHDGKLDVGSVLLQKPFTLDRLSSTIEKAIRAEA